MRIRTLYIISILSLICSCVSAQEQGEKKVERTTAIAIGHVNRLDTYLSPEEYRGTDFRIIYNSLKSRPSKWDLQGTHEGAIDYSRNRAKNAHTLAAHYDFAFAMMRRWEMDNLTLRVGGMADAYIGFAYDMRNTADNPAQAYASLAIGAAGTATYRLHIGKYTFPINYEVRIPLIGMMFSPAYGQSYYEIFNRGNYDHNIVLATCGTPQLRHQLTVDITTGSHTAIRLGYLGDIRQSTPNSLKQHVYTNSFFIGLTVSK